MTIATRATKAESVLLDSATLFQPELPGQVYDRPREISRYLLMHYGSREDTFDRWDHPLAAAYGYAQRLSEALRLAAARTGTEVRTALDVGCNVGGVTHQLATWVPDLVTGLDISPRAVEVARELTAAGTAIFHVSDGPTTRPIRATLPEQRIAEVCFEVGDGAALPGRRGGYDAVIVSNVLDRVADPADCLAQFRDSGQVLRRGGLLMIACPWSWYPEYSDPSMWLGADDPEKSSELALKALLGEDFTLVGETDEPGVLRQNPREYDYFEAHVSIWRKH